MTHNTGGRPLGQEIILPWFQSKLYECGGGIILLIDSRHSDPLVKFPGGKKEAHDVNDEAAAQRELLGETGLDMYNATLFQRIGTTFGYNTAQQTHYPICFWAARFEEEYVRRSVRTIGDEGEIVNEYALDWIRCHRAGFLEVHRVWLEQACRETGKYYMHDILFGEVTATQAA